MRRILYSAPMQHKEPARDWIVDLTKSLASCGAHVITFSQNLGHNLGVSFIAGGDASLEERCLIAGEATAAIKAKMRSGG